MSVPHPEHSEFVARYCAGRILVRVDRERAARFISGRMLLPFVLLPVLGLSVALALIGHWIVGAIAFALALLLRALVRRSSQGYVVHRALEDERFYREALAARLIELDETANA